MQILTALGILHPDSGLFVFNKIRIVWILNSDLGMKGTGGGILDTFKSRHGGQIHKHQQILGVFVGVYKSIAPKQIK